MKKLVIFLSAMVLFAATAAAQSVTTPSPDLKLQYKGARVSGNDVELTVVLTNLSSNEVVLNLVGGVYQTGMAGSIVYDNEGNIYEMGNILVSFGNKSFTEQYSAGNLPSKTPVKCHVLVRNVVSEATTFAKVKLCFLCPQLDIKNTGICFELDDIRVR